MIPDRLRRNQDAGIEDDHINRPDPDGSERVYVEETTRDRLTDLLVAYKWPLVLASTALLVGYLLGWYEVPEVPPEAWSLLAYVLSGSIIALPAGWYLVEYFRDERGVEVLDLDPVGDDHRHLRVGSELWEDLTVRTPWGEETGTEDLRRATINGRTGYTVLDMRVEDEEGLVCVSSTVGTLSTVELRTYEESLRYVRERLSRRANRAVALRANLGPIAREAAERVVYDLVKSSEESGMPSGDRIEQTVDDVLGTIDLGAESEEESPSTSRPAQSNGSNGHEEEIEDLGDLLDAADDGRVEP